jgi:hypothetical protein
VARRSIINKEILDGAAMQFAPLRPVIQFLISSLIAVACFVATPLAVKAEMKIIRDCTQRSTSCLPMCRDELMPYVHCSIFIDITGEITERDAEKFQEISSVSERADFFVVELDSMGGSVSAAIDIGRLVRKYDGWTVIPTDAKCYSSCALIFIAGVRRYSYGELGLHRPYFSSTPRGREALEKAVPLLLSTLKSYIADMGVTDNFYQQMVNTEPSHMVIYQYDDFTTLFPLEDPLYAEIEISRDARAHGVTTSEMRQRNKDADENCKPPRENSPETDEGFRQYGVCIRAMEWGLSERAYLERESKSTRECQFSGPEQAAIAQTPKKLRSDLPVYMRQETCVRNIMLGRSVPAQRSWFGWLFGR